MAEIAPPSIPVPTCCGTPPATSSVTTKFHFSMNVSDMQRSIGFYRILFGTEPAKAHHDYAKFELDQPPLVFSLVPNPPGAGGGLSHLGFPVGSREEVDAIGQRLEQAGLKVSCQNDTVCGYARQDKIWIADPDLNHWEIYVVYEDVEPSDAPPMRPAAPSPENLVSLSQGAPAPQRIIWEHRVLEPLPERIPHEDHSVDEVRLQGAFNSKFNADERSHLLAESLRVLKPGGVLDVHGLVSDRPLTKGLPALPGVAALVKQVLVESQPVDEISAAGFTAIEISKLPSKAVFALGGVEMREIKLRACKPFGEVSETTSTRVVIYKGPFAAAVSDSGKKFERGVRTETTEQEWQELSQSAAASQFVFVKNEPSTCGTSCEK